MNDKKALVTGAAMGIGKATAELLAQKGAQVLIADIEEDALQKTAKEIEDMGGKVITAIADISKEKDVRTMVRKAVDEFGQLDIACNNAGIEGEMALTANYSLDEWDRVQNINLRGQFLCMKEEIAAMLESGGGSIVNVSSILGKVGYQQAPAYTAAKHGLLGLTKTAAIEYAQEGIRINAVCPAFIDTPMLERAGITTDEEVKEQTIGLHPVGRLGHAKEVAEAIVWLASEQASFVEGHALMVDGGYTAK
ncbi:SDR family NAD(P)-dependent oxidoreductase [Fodinibius halophilus]|uniref:SDR family oxidoreductase n=1 Tax=Fodinibius halophilus TaxID=1736908 RepID=A0A6M1TBY2_9BACT|nr:glucose 1-dehydrogenase [Fodinibius halophilus]NGP89863.1 SDR family oxidoreductase [Fodinibius halophilus]